jgi:hypothetical protein
VEADLKGTPYQTKMSDLERFKMGLLYMKMLEKP